MATTVQPNHSLKSILFIDIETVPDLEKFDSFYDLYLKRYNRDIQDQMQKTGYTEEVVTEMHFRENSGLYAEFSKVLCISVGFVSDSGLRVKCIIDQNEDAVLKRFSELLDSFKVSRNLCAHNGKDFDFPYLMRRYIVNRMPVPMQLNIMGKKPWEVLLEDTMEMWAGTQFKYKCSLDLMAKIFGLPSPKEKMDGKKVQGIWNDPDMPQEEKIKMISDYCNADVVTLVNCYCYIKGFEPIQQIEFVF